MNAVAHIHDKGIVHRDLKPSNVMVTDNGLHVKLVDFGLADADNYAVLKQPAGTLKYMSQEQKKVAKTDVRNDIYSLGIVLGQMNLGGVYKKVVKRCIKPAEQRYQNMAELNNDIQRYQKSRKRIVFVYLALPVVLLMVAVGWLAWQWNGQKQITNHQQKLLNLQSEKINTQNNKIADLEKEAQDAMKEQLAQRSIVSR